MTDCLRGRGDLRCQTGAVHTSLGLLRLLPASWSEDVRCDRYQRRTGGAATKWDAGELVHLGGDGERANG